MELLHAQETEEIIGILYAVRNAMGAGWSEEIYHQALLKALMEANIPVQHKPRQTLVHKGKPIQTFEADLILYDKIILELKVNPGVRGKDFPSANEAQLLHYLKSFGKDLGLLVNFAHAKVGLKRIAYQPSGVKILEDFERIKPYITPENRPLLLVIRQCLLSIANDYGTGYPEAVYRKIISTELQARNIHVNADVEIPATWQDSEIGIQTTQHLIVNGQILVFVRATLAHPTTYDYLKTRSYLKALGLEIGLVLNFGRNTFQIIGTGRK